jgi:hypothetical protein
MAHYAFIDENNIVTEVITGVDENIIQIDLDGTEVGGSSESWETWYGNFRGQTCKRTSYNGNYRKNYAGIGYTYDEQRDAFIPPKTYPSWTLNEDTYLWDPLISHPDTNFISQPYQIYNRYFWNEDIVNWELQKPFESWELSQDNYYISPIPYPNDGNNYYWDEDTLSWIIR